MKHFILTFLILLSGCATTPSPFETRSEINNASIKAEGSMKAFFLGVTYAYIANINGVDTYDWSIKQYVKPGINQVAVVASIRAGHKALKIIEFEMLPNTSYIAKVEYRDKIAHLSVFEEETKKTILQTTMVQFGAYENQAADKARELIDKALNK